MSTPAVTPQPPNKALPDFARAGDALTWPVQTALPPGWTVFLVLSAVVANVPTRIQVPPVGVDGGGLATFTLASSVTSLWAPARYSWALFSLDPSGDRAQLAEGQIRLDPDPAGATPVDPRTQDERILANLRALLEGKSLDDVSMYKIGTRELTKMSIAELMKAEALYEGRVRRAAIRRGEFRRTSTLGVTFGGR